MKYTRKDYMDGQCSHQEYYAQFVTDYVKQRVAAQIGVDRIRNSKDEHLNDIPLSKWDAIFGAGMPRNVTDAMRAAGDHPTMTGAVCISKAAARLLIA